MRIYRASNYEELSRKAANIISSQVILKPDCVLGLATGSSPIGTYKQLIEWYKKGDLDFSQVKTVNLDEYRGLGKESDQSYVYFMHHNLFDHINIKPENINLPNGKNPDAVAECKRYDGVIESMGGVDIQLLGIGRNGHIGFNEPNDHFIDGCHVVSLSPSTIEANTRFFEDSSQVPRQAVSLGIGAIMRARRVVLIATGEDKAQAVRDAVLGDVTPQVQASILRYHPNALFLLDKAAASLL